MRCVEHLKRRKKILLTTAVRDEDQTQLYSSYTGFLTITVCVVALFSSKFQVHLDDPVSSGRSPLVEVNISILTDRFADKRWHSGHDFILYKAELGKRLFGGLKLRRFLQSDRWLASARGKVRV